MTRKLKTIFFALMLWFVFIGYRPAIAATSEDFFFEKKTETFIDGELKGPAKALKVWIKGNRIRYEDKADENKYVLILMDKGKTYEMNKAEKNFKEMPNEMAKIKEIEGNSLVISKRTGQKKKVEKWNCYEVVLDTTMGGKKMKATCWLSEEIKMSREMIDRIAKFSQMKILEELAKFPGYPVKLTMDSNLQGKQVRIVSTLVDVAKQTLKDDFFKIPFDYNKTEATKTEAK